MPATTTSCVVMGVSGSGKTTVAEELARRLGWKLVEGDDLHPPANVAKMRAGHPLHDADRRPWLDRVAARIGQWEAAGENGLLTCSALKRAYRDRLREGHPSVWFAHVDAHPDVLRERLAQRKGHYMPASLLESQLAILQPLEPDEPGVMVGGDAPCESIVRDLLDQLRRSGAAVPHPGGPMTHPDDTYDVIVIGGGPTGENVAARAVRGGLTAALVEVELYGGECSYWACMPSKALLRPVEVAAMAARLPGVPTGPLDVAAILGRRDSFTSHLSDAGQEKWVVDTGITPVRGHGRLAGEKTVEVTRPDGTVDVLHARQAVVLATGTSAVVPDLPGLRDSRPWTSREVTNMKEVPRRLVVVGGGVVAVEMAQAAKGLGAEQVVLLVRGQQLLERMEPYAGDLVADGLRETGVEIRYGVSASSVSRDSDGVDGGSVTVQLDDGSAVVGDELLVAIGRHPRTDDLGLDTVGLEAGSSVAVDDSMRVPGSDWLYAAGDVNGRALLTHMGKYQARICGDVIAARAKGEPDDGPALRATAPVPQVVFTDPQACSVGPTLADARRSGLVVREVAIDLGGVAGAALLADGYRGRASLVVDDGDVVVGATFVGQDVAELLHSATVAVTAGLTLQQLWHAVPSYPTVSEGWLRLLEAAGL